MIRKISLRLICLCLVLFMALAANTAIIATEVSQDDTVQIAVMTADAKRGDRLNAKNVAMVDAKKAGLPDNVITNIDDVYGKSAAEDLYAGECLYPAKLTDRNNVKSDDSLLLKDIKKSTDEFVLVTDYIKVNTGEDVTTHIQAIIDKNPTRTIYFPDGEYVISSSLITSSNPMAGVTLFLSPNAVLKASDNWKEIDGKNALVSIGGDYNGGDHINDNTSIGSYFGVIGGVFDCNGKADGIAIISSRESIIYGCTIIDPEVGIDIRYGANSSSSDADVENITIYGTKRPTSIGAHVSGNDNTFTNIKIYDMETGIKSGDAINSFKNIQCIQTGTIAENPYYDRSVGIEACGWIMDCYVENTATAYRFTYSILEKEITSGLVATWTQPYKNQLAFEWRTVFNSIMTDCRADFYDGTSENIFLKVDSAGSAARLDSPVLNSTYEKKGTYKQYVSKKGWIELGE